MRRTLTSVESIFWQAFEMVGAVISPASLVRSLVATVALLAVAIVLAYSLGAFGFLRLANWAILLAGLADVLRPLVRDEDVAALGARDAAERAALDAPDPRATAMLVGDHRPDRHQAEERGADQAERWAVPEER